MNFAVIFNDLEQFHLNKDVGNIPKVISQRTHGKSYIYYKMVGSIDTFDKQLNLMPVKSKSKFLYYLKIILSLYREKVKVVNLYHLTTETLILSFVLKKLGFIVYVKADINYDDADMLCKYLKRKQIKLNPFLFRYPDIISVESNRAFEMLSKISMLRDKLFYFPNTVNCSELDDLDWRKREKNILIVGRHGVPVKNTETVLNALEHIDDLSGWQIIFVGSKTSEFEKLFNEYKLKHSLVFLEDVKQTELFELYSRSKVFLMPSLSEGFSLAMAEAAYFGCQIVSTDVGGFEDLTNYGQFGKLIEGTDNMSVLNALRDVIYADEFDYLEWLEYRGYIKANFNINKYVDNLCNQLRGKV